MFQTEVRLLDASRLPVLNKSKTFSARELVTLTAIGLFAACLSYFWDWSLRIPGHAILRVGIPLSLGLALVPRRGAGHYLGFVALISTLLLKSLFPIPGDGLGIGSMVSLTLFAPTIELSLMLAKRKCSIWITFALAGLTCNLIAFLSRGTFKVLTAEHSGTRLFKEWLSVAVISYAICGLLSGGLAAMIFFRRDNRQP